MNAQALAANDPEVLASVTRRYRELATSEDEIKSIRIPVLAIVGRDDAFRPQVDALKKRMPELQVVVVEGADHVSVLERPELLQALKAFLRQ